MPESRSSPQSQFKILHLTQLFTVTLLVLSPGHSQIYLAAVEKNQLRDKIWEWPGDEAITYEMKYVLLDCFVQF